MTVNSAQAELAAVFIGNAGYNLKQQMRNTHHPLDREQLIKELDRIQKWGEEISTYFNMRR